MKFLSKKPHYEHLRKKWLGRHKAVTEKLLDTHGHALRHLAAGGLGGLMLLNTSGINAPVPYQGITHESEIAIAKDKNALLAQALKPVVPGEVKKLETIEEDKITHLLSEKFGFLVRSEMEGIRLNRSYGMIGGEQHLYRYPGDSLEKHADNASDWAMYGPAGIAPGLGAWGYFARSQAEFTEKDKERERYYLAVPTFLAPGFAEDFGRYRDFFKYRKMLVVNPRTGQSVVAVVGDAGPAEWTGKHLGGSPEVMHYLGLASGPRKGAVLYFFIDDPNDTIPLGRVEMKGAK